MRSICWRTAEAAALIFAASDHLKDAGDGNLVGRQAVHLYKVAWVRERNSMYERRRSGLEYSKVTDTCDHKNVQVMNKCHSFDLGIFPGTLISLLVDIPMV